MIAHLMHKTITGVAILLMELRVSQAQKSGLWLIDWLIFNTNISTSSAIPGIQDYGVDM
jgi:hypothetical protein